MKHLFLNYTNILYSTSMVFDKSFQVRGNFSQTFYFKATRNKIVIVDTYGNGYYALFCQGKNIAGRNRNPRTWRCNNRILNRLRSLHKRSKNIVIDWSRKFAKHIVLKAKRMRSVIALEDLGKLWFNASKKPGLAVKLSRYAYRKLQVAITSKAIEYNVPVLLINRSPHP